MASLDYGGLIMNQNIIFSIISITFSTVFLIFALKLPPSETGDSLGAGGWPVFVLSLMLLLSIILLVRSVLEKKRFVIRDNDSVEEDEETTTYKIKLFARHWYVFVILALYFFTMPFLGFLVSTFFFVLFLTCLLNMKKKIIIFLTGLISSVALTFLFATFLKLPLPRGQSIFYELSLLFQ